MSDEYRREILEQGGGSAEGRSLADIFAEFCGKVVSAFYDNSGRDDFNGAQGEASIENVDGSRITLKASITIDNAEGKTRQ